METGTKINIPPPSVQKDEITISGEKEGVAIAKEKILRIYKEKVSQLFSRILQPLYHWSEIKMNTKLDSKNFLTLGSKVISFGSMYSDVLEDNNL